MRILTLLLLSVTVSALAGEHRFPAADGVELFADWHAADHSGAATVVLFHQAGSNGRGEYSSIAPKLSSLGYNVLVMDQRSGADRFGESNRTVAGLGGKKYSYCEAYPDLLAAVNYASTLSKGSVAVWGSSYSAGLVIRLAVEHPDKVSAALAFSPANSGPMAVCDPMESIAELRTALIAFWPVGEMQWPPMVALAEAFRAAEIKFHLVEDGVHGSSMLAPDRSKADLDALWSTVQDFLASNL